MAKKRAARSVARKVKDKWRSKSWYKICAPSLFNEAPIGETMTDEPDKLKGRIAEATLQEVMGDFSKMHVKCYFRIRGVRGTDAVTTFEGHDFTSDYVRRLVRRSHSKIDDVCDVTTADGFKVRLKPMIVSERRTQATQAAVMRTRARAVIKASAGLTYNELVKQVLQGDISKGIYDVCRTIAPLKRVEIRKSELLSEPVDAVAVLDVFAPPPAAPEPEAAQTPPEAGVETAGSAQPADSRSEEPADEASREP